MVARWWRVAIPIVCVATVAAAVALRSGRRWVRDDPLVGAVAVSSVTAGALSLADGRILTPAGVGPSAGVAPAEFDQFLRAATNQGVVVERDLGDGRAFLLVEPKFYNWCGTGRAAGWYIQCPLSELAVLANDADADLAQDGLTDRERWRLEGVRLLDTGVADEPVRIGGRGDSLRFDTQFAMLRDYEACLEMLGSPPP